MLRRRQRWGNLPAIRGMGSTRYAGVVPWPGLQFWPLRRFPYRVFYVELADCVDEWRVLHASRDLPETLRGATAPDGPADG